MANLNGWLDSVQDGLKTEKGAMARLEKVMGLLTENRANYFVYRKPDGKFLPVVIAKPNDWAVGSYAHFGIYVTN